MKVIYCELQGFYIGTNPNVVFMSYIFYIYRAVFGSYQLLGGKPQKP